MNSKIKIWILLIAISFVAACGSALYMPVSGDADRTGIPLDNLMLGRNLYVNKCGSCHNLHLPEQYDREKWLSEMQKMKVKAKISEKESQLITSFLLARCKKE